MGCEPVVRYLLPLLKIFMTKDVYNDIDVRAMKDTELHLSIIFKYLSTYRYTNEEIPFFNNQIVLTGLTNLFLQNQLRPQAAYYIPSQQPSFRMFQLSSPFKDAGKIGQACVGVPPSRHKLLLPALQSKVRLQEFDEEAPSERPV